MSNNYQTLTSSSVLGGGWSSFEVRTSDSYGETRSLTTIRAPKGEVPFVDIAIEERTGTTKRSKYCSVRLHDEVMRKLYEILKERFAP